MPYEAKKRSSRPKPRKLDEESGMNRTSRPSKSSRKPRERSPSPDSESDGSQTDSSVQSYQLKKQKDDSRRPRPSAKPTNRRNQNQRPTDAPEEADEDDVDKQPQEKESENGYLTVLAMSYRAGFTTKSYPALSRYIPDTSAMFTVLQEMCSIVQENTLIHERIPAYTSIGMYTYYAHVVHFHILRAIAAEDELSRVERRILRSYEAVGPAESWPIAAPLVPFIQSLGKCNVNGGKYGTILPAFPNYTALHQATPHALSHLNTVQGVARLPILPALQEFLYNYAHNHAAYVDSKLYPKPSATLGGAADAFVGIDASTATSAAFQTLAFSAAWKQPKETGVDTYSAIDAQKRAIMINWNIPAVGNDKDIHDHESFLGLEDGVNKKWIKQLLKLSSGFNAFFKGGVNLDAIPPITVEESHSHVTFKIENVANRVTATAQGWYHERENLKFDLQTYIVRETSQLNLQVASATAPRRIYGQYTTPATPAIPAVFETAATGPYFSDTLGPRVEIEGYTQPDPIDQASTIIEARVYDNSGSA